MSIYASMSILARSILVMEPDHCICHYTWSSQSDERASYMWSELQKKKYISQDKTTVYTAYIIY